jgi:iron complex outermembrane receptor protein
LAAIPLVLASANVLAEEASFQASNTGEGSLGQRANQQSALEEIVITSRKVGAESLQSAPITATAVNMDSVNRGQLTDLRDIARLAPNVQFETSAAFPGFANFTIRGLTLNNSLRTLDPTVAVVFDGLAFGDPFGMVLDTFDLESVEILRGPQGVLIGRNATGGAVNLRTRRPDDEFGIRGSVRLGNLDRFDQTFSVEGPLSDTVRAKIAVLHRRSDGFFKDDNGGTFKPAPGNPSGMLDNPVVKPPVRENVWTIRPIVVWEPSDDLEITLIGEYVDGDYGGNASRILLARDPLTEGLGYTPPEFGFSTDHNATGDTTMKTKRAVLEVNWDVGPGTLTSVSGYREVDYVTNGDNDGTPFTLLHFPENEADSTHFTQELRYVTDIADDFTLLTGAYYSTLEMTQLENREVNLILAGVAPPAPMIRQQTFFDQDSEILGFFGNLDYRVTDRLTVSGGLRYTYEKKKIDIGLLRVCPTAPDFSTCPTDSVQDRESWDDLSPRIALDYQINDDIFAYASYTKAFRSGAFNGRATTALSVSASEPEKAKTYEIGLKSEFLDRRLRANFAAFYTDFADIQATLIGPDTAQTILNAADATIKGIEAELTYLATAGLRFDVMFGYTDASYDRFDGLDLTGDGTPDPALAEELDFPRVPKVTLTGIASYDFTVPNVTGDFNARVSYAWRDSIYTDLVNNEPTKVPSYGLLDASFDYAPNDNVTFRVYGTNITNEKMWEISIPSPFAYIVNGGIGRTYGIETTFNF